MNKEFEINAIKKKTSVSANGKSDFDLYPSALFVLNAELHISDSNKLAQQLTGKSAEEITNLNFLSFVDKNDQENFLSSFQKVFGTSELKAAEIKIKTADSTYSHCLYSLRSFVMQKTGDFYCSVAVIDFTPHKMKEEVKRDSESRFENMANTAPVKIWIAGVDGLFIFVNKVWIDYSGKDAGDLLGMNWLKDVHPDDLENVMNNYREAFRSRESFTTEFRLRGKENNYEWMMIKGTPRLNEDNIFVGFIGSCTNINTQKEYEVKIKKINSELVEINAAKDKFFSIISHDLRSPLAGLMGLLDLLFTTYDTLDQDEKMEIIEEAHKTSKGAFTLMENLLEWSRIQTGKIPYQPENMEIVPIIRNLERLFNQNLKSKQIVFTNNIEPGTVTFSDMRMTETILRNLISNAIKFTHVKGTISVSCLPERDYLVIRVTDNGVGIDPANIDKLFRMDVSFTTKGTAKENGTGLGLTLCKELVEMQGGKIGVESAKDAGSTFYFTLPSAC